MRYVHKTNFKEGNVVQIAIPKNLPTVYGGVIPIWIKDNLGVRGYVLSDEHNEGVKVLVLQQSGYEELDIWNIWLSLLYK